MGRTFIQPSTRLRQLGVAKKFGALAENVEGKRIVLIDDSIVRGNTIGPIIKLLRDAGAKEVHIRIASPPLLYPCYMGINIPTREELIGNKLNPEQLAKHVGESLKPNKTVYCLPHIHPHIVGLISTGADSLAYLSVEGLVKAVQINKAQCNPSKSGYCTACLTGDYPGGLPEDLSW